MRKRFSQFDALLWIIYRFRQIDIRLIVLPSTAIASKTTRAITDIDIVTPFFVLASMCYFIAIDNVLLWRYSPVKSIPVTPEEDSPKLEEAIEAAEDAAKTPDSMESNESGWWGSWITAAKSKVYKSIDT